MDQLRQAAQQAQVALDELYYSNGTQLAEQLYEETSAALRAALSEQPAEQEPGNWSVYNSGAEVASGLSLAEALEYLTPERLARQWCAVCVVDQSNLPTPQPATHDFKEWYGGSETARPYCATCGKTRAEHEVRVEQPAEQESLTDEDTVAQRDELMKALEKVRAMPQWEHTSITIRSEIDAAIAKVEGEKT